MAVVLILPSESSCGVVHSARKTGQAARSLLQHTPCAWSVSRRDAATGRPRSAREPGRRLFGEEEGRVAAAAAEGGRTRAQTGLRRPRLEALPRPVRRHSCRAGVRVHGRVRRHMSALFSKLDVAGTPPCIRTTSRQSRRHRSLPTNRRSMGRMAAPGVRRS